MLVIELKDRDRIEAFLRRAPGMHLYAIADLDEFFWPETQWYGLVKAGALLAVCLVFHKLSTPLLYAVCTEADEPTRLLLLAIVERLPARFHASLGPGFDGVFGAAREPGRATVHLKMLLTDRRHIEAVDTGDCELVGVGDLDDLKEFYGARAYAAGEEDGRFFEPYMLEIGPYFVIREAGRIVTAGGVHVRSAEQRVAALGNIATMPAARGRGLARRLTAALCRDLVGRVEHIGLNVAVDNLAAVRCYRGLGFEPVCEFVEQPFTAC